MQIYIKKVNHIVTGGVVARRYITDNISFRSGSNCPILVNDNIPLNENSNESYIKKFSYLPQETIMLNKSIKRI